MPASPRAPTGFPGSNGHIPRENGFLAEVLRHQGWNTFWVGKNHIVPRTSGTWAVRGEWPLARGFDRFYGFIGGETDQWYPDLVDDNHYVDQPYLPEDGYHLSKDLADQALTFIPDSKQSDPTGRGSCSSARAPTTPRTTRRRSASRSTRARSTPATSRTAIDADPHAGARDHARGHRALPINPMGHDIVLAADLVRPWDSLSDDEKRLFARMAEVYAGFLEYTDHQIGRLVDYLEETGQLDNTLSSSSPTTAPRPRAPRRIGQREQVLQRVPRRPGREPGHARRARRSRFLQPLPDGVGLGFKAPFSMFKRYSYQGGIGDPMVVHWPKGSRPGQVRHQYHHAIDVVPTILETCGIEAPDDRRLRADADRRRVDAGAIDDAPTVHRPHTQYYAMLGTRGIYHDGWKAVAVTGRPRGREPRPGPLGAVPHRRGPGRGPRPGRPSTPRRSRSSINSGWPRPASTTSCPRRPHAARDPPRWSGRALGALGPVHLLPGTPQRCRSGRAERPGAVVRIVAELEITDVGAEGVIFAHGSRFGGHALT